MQKPIRYEHEYMKGNNTIYLFKLNYSCQVSTAFLPVYFKNRYSLCFTESNLGGHILWQTDTVCQTVIEKETHTRCSTTTGYMARTDRRCNLKWQHLQVHSYHRSIGFDISVKTKSKVAFLWERWLGLIADLSYLTCLMCHTSSSFATIMTC